MHHPDGRYIRIGRKPGGSGVRSGSLQHIGSKHELVAFAVHTIQAAHGHHAETGFFVELHSLTKHRMCKAASPRHLTCREQGVHSPCALGKHSTQQDNEMQISGKSVLWTCGMEFCAARVAIETEDMAS